MKKKSLQINKLLIKEIEKLLSKLATNSFSYSKEEYKKAAKLAVKRNAGDI